MDIDLRLPSEEQDKHDEEPNAINNMLASDDKLHIEGDTRTLLDVGDVRGEDGITLNSPTSDLVDLKEDVNLEPLPGMEFVSHQEAYAFYQEYARSMGFNTAIQNSRRSKTSREFIDAKFACSRYGTKREYDKGNRPRVRQCNKQEPESAGRRSCGKTDCKASMHVKRRPDGRWVIHSFVKEHNHELLPAQAVSEQTRKIYAAMARHYAEYKNVRAIKLSEEGSLSQESYSIACRALDDAFTNCMSVNNASKTLPEAGTSATQELLSIEDDGPSRSFTKTTKKKNPTKKRKVNTEAEAMGIGPQETLHQMDKLNPRQVTTFDGFYGTQQGVQGMVQLNLMAPTRNNYYGNQQTMQGLGQLNSIASNHDGYYGQQSMHGLVCF
ncbi:hypothetical protein Cgig2_001041 [Carnegiea gigantea]|uniref:FAR1 domain-containing protein n=1 Tax=Carnegiea gigantea TaxID=171969 RepID=A0A9Q1GVS1_9CARY|nr:hypothetical protein Cgig2_001041 [Carnegiea gigantea]